MLVSVLSGVRNATFWAAAGKEKAIANTQRYSDAKIGRKSALLALGVFAFLHLWVKNFSDIVIEVANFIF